MNPIPVDNQNAQQESTNRFSLVHPNPPIQQSAAYFTLPGRQVQPR